MFCTFWINLSFLSKYYLVFKALQSSVSSLRGLRLRPELYDQSSYKQYKQNNLSLHAFIDFSLTFNCIKYQYYISFIFCPLDIINTRIIIYQETSLKCITMLLRKVLLGCYNKVYIYSKETTLSQKIWELREEGIECDIKWKQRQPSHTLQSPACVHFAHLKNIISFSNQSKLQLTKKMK